MGGRPESGAGLRRPPWNVAFAPSGHPDACRECMLKAKQTLSLGLREIPVIEPKFPALRKTIP